MDTYTPCLIAILQIPRSNPCITTEERVLFRNAEKQVQAKSEYIRIPPQSFSDFALTWQP